MRSLRPFPPSFHTYNPLHALEDSPEQVRDDQTILFCIYEQLVSIIDAFPAFVGYVNSEVEPHSKPRHVVRNWARYVLGTALVGTGSWYLFRHSSFCGSNDLNTWTTTLRHSLALFADEHVNTPVYEIYKEIFGGANRTMTDPAMVEQSRRSLARMLFDFGKDVMSPESTLKQLKDKSDACDMNIVMARYEESMSSTSGMALSTLSGDLPRMLLIQVQKLKVDVEVQMLDIEKLMRENELNLQLMATVPAFMLGSCILYAARSCYETMRSRSQVGGTRAIFETILAIERMLNRASGDDNGAVINQEVSSWTSGSLHPADVELPLNGTLCLSDINHGRMLMWVRRLEVNLTASIIPHESTREVFRQDVRELCSPRLSCVQLLRTIRRMHRSYSFMITCSRDGIMALNTSE